MAADGDTAERVDWTPWVYLNVEWGGQRGAARQVLLTIHFGEHHLDLPGGRVSFGLLKGQLQVTPSAGKFPSGSLWPKSVSDSTVAAKRKVRREPHDDLDHRTGHRSVSAPGTFDCFLSHNSRDKPAVRALAVALRARGIAVWLDEEQLRPGLSAQKQMDAGIRQSRSIAVLVGADGLGPWEQEEMEAALSLAVRDRWPVIPVLLPDAPGSPELPSFLASRTWVDLRASASGDGPAGLASLIWGITGLNLSLGVVRHNQPGGNGPEDDRAEPDQARGANRRLAMVQKADANASAACEADTGDYVEASDTPLPWRVVVQGSESRPLWKFTPLDCEPYLQGRLPKQEIGLLAGAHQTVTLVTAFTITSRNHIRPLSGDGLWPDDFS